MVLHKNLKMLKRSISEKILRRSPKEEPSRINSTPSIESIEEDPYKEILRLNSDNISHLVFHGSSLRQLHSFCDLDNFSPSSKPSITPPSIPSNSLSPYSPSPSSLSPSPSSPSPSFSTSSSPKSSKLVSFA